MTPASLPRARAITGLRLHLFRCAVGVVDAGQPAYPVREAKEPGRGCRALAGRVEDAARPARRAEVDPPNLSGEDARHGILVGGPARGEARAAGRGHVIPDDMGQQGQDDGVPMDGAGAGDDDPFRGRLAIVPYLT